MLYLVRHGESEWNAAGLVQGQTAHPRLTQRGREQAAWAGELVESDRCRGRVEASALISSDLQRALETADIIGARLGLVPTADPRLREQQLGELQGLPSDEAAARLADVDWTDGEVLIGGGESVRQLADRMAAVLAPLVARRAATIVVSHGDAIRLTLGWLAGHEPVDAPWTPIPNGCVYAVAADRSYRQLG